MKRIRVLLADDHRVLREGLKVLLEALEGVEIVGEAAEGREAVQRALDLRPDVVLMDVEMPGLNGIEAARLLCEKWPEARIVMLSMHSSSEHVYRALEAGALGYLLKESAGGEVRAAVQAAHAGRRYVTGSLRYAVPAPQGKRRASPIQRLSPREREVLQLVVEGKTSAEIARVMLLSPKTVDTYRSRLMVKLGVRDVPALVKLAILHGITSPQ